MAQLPPGIAATRDPDGAVYRAASVPWPMGFDPMQAINRFASLLWLDVLSKEAHCILENHLHASLRLGRSLMILCSLRWRGAVREWFAGRPHVR